jgi:hypothetical protein
MDGTPDPNLASSVWSQIAPEMIAEAHRGFLYTSGVPEVVYLPAGRCEILATRGPAYSMARAIRARQIVGSTGPLIELSPWTRDGRPRAGVLDVTVRGPAWMPIDEVRVWVNGELFSVRDFPPGPVDPHSATQQAHRLEIPLALEGDAFIVVEAGDGLARLVSPEPHAGPLGRAFPNLRVLAFTNPLLIDFEGDCTIWDRPPDSGQSTVR